METQQVVRQRFLPPRAAELIALVVRDFPHIGIQMYRDADIYMIVHNPVVEYQIAVEKIEAVEASPTGCRIRPIRCCSAVPMNSCRCFGIIWKRPVSTACTVCLREDQYFELLPQGVSKGSAAQVLAGYCGVSGPHVAAVGDYYNDVELLKAVPRRRWRGTPPMR